ncbi:MBL fold metallo-hydrolase [Methanosarcina sp. KYL-1]|uniref:MBL fold metallo-hydrolase n=1 Tax=Methanosarcina sp. KYL-1 TaxID=2602068 RepID=UPI002100BD02|nr:MBL fold metallo-hydrolase [Methanosarcina sp. KYL-1]MCQ1535142.1 MBL fold metallo-hydrolase [Methanosarcina sp. KYL-1]
MIRLKVIYDNEAKPGFTGGWGFSALLETEAETLLFDTGWDGTLLLENLEKMGVSLPDVRKLVLSHQHWDHIGGLPEVLKANPGLTVYVPSSFSKNLKAEIAKRAKLVEIGEAQQISPGIRSTGELGDKIKEQSLLLDTGKGLYVLTGCAHPGLAEILGAARRFGKVRGIIGGLHDSKEFGELEGLELIAAGHCTTHKEEIKELYPAEFVEIGAGLCLELE